MSGEILIVPRSLMREKTPRELASMMRDAGVPEWMRAKVLREQRDELAEAAAEAEAERMAKDEREWPGADRRPDVSRRRSRRD